MAAVIAAMFFLIIDNMKKIFLLPRFIIVACMLRPF